MVNTNPADFKKFLGCLTDEQKSKIWFIPIRSNSKIPDTKIQFKENSKVRLTIYDAYQRLKNGQNVGICATLDSLMFLDIDVQDNKILASQVILDTLESIQTITVQSRNGGYQYYFLNEGKYVNQLVYDENKTIIGELRANWWYVVSVGSYVDTDENNFNGDGTYRFLSGDTLKSIPDTVLNLELESGEIKKNRSVRTNTNEGHKITQDEYKTLMFKYNRSTI